MSDFSETFEFLERFAPSELESIKRAFPSVRSQLSSGLILGGKPFGECEDHQLGKGRRAAAELALQTIVRESERAGPIITRRLKIARAVELTGSVVAATASTGAVIANLNVSHQWLTATFAALAAVASVAPLIVGGLKGTVASSNVTLPLLRLKECAWEAQESLAQVLDETVAIEAMRIRVNELSRKANIALFELGFREPCKAI